MTIEIILLSVSIAIMLALFIAIMVKNKKQSNVSALGFDDELLAKQLKTLFENQAVLFSNLSNVQNESLKNYIESINQFLVNNVNMQRDNLQDIQKRLEKILSSNEEKLDSTKKVIADSLEKLQLGNEKKLEEMRVTVDEKLNSSLQTRLNESFSLISERLEAVYKGLGEMQNLASGVGDLKKVLSNVKNRGVWGEISLGNILEGMFAPNQFDKNVATKPNTQERVDYALKIPTKDGTTLLPIDSKFPIEDYERLVKASESGDVNSVDSAVKALEKRVKEEAKSIKDKYIYLPNTTDFAVLFLPIEGLYAEVAKRVGLIEELQQNYKVIVCGPTTLSALLSSLQLGFKTVAIEKRSSEIWSLLGVFKHEFENFSLLLAKTQKKLEEASDTIDFASKKTKTIARKLKDVSYIEGTSLETSQIAENIEDSSDE